MMLAVVLMARVVAVVVADDGEWLWDSAGPVRRTIQGMLSSHPHSNIVTRLQDDGLLSSE